jgi:hypothetical protein
MYARITRKTTFPSRVSNVARRGSDRDVTLDILIRCCGSSISNARTLTVQAPIAFAKGAVFRHGTALPGIWPLAPVAAASRVTAKAQG